MRRKHHFALTLGIIVGFAALAWWIRHQLKDLDEILDMDDPTLVDFDCPSQIPDVRNGHAAARRARSTG